MTRTGAPGGASTACAGRARWVALAAITLVSFLLLLEDTAVSVALTTIGRRLGMSLTGLEWVINAYTLTLAIMVLPAGKLADAFGRRRAFLGGLTVFVLASLLAGLSTSGAMLIAARALQGVAAAFTSSAALSIISVSFSDRERGAALGVWSGASALGLAVGPVVGAMITQMLGWEWLFLLNVPLGGIAILVTRVLLSESSSGQRRHTLPWRAVVVWAGALLSLVTGLTEASKVGWGAPEVLVLEAVGLTLLSAFAALEHRSRWRLIDRALVHSRQTIGANVVSLLSTAVMCNLFVFISLYLQTVRGYDTMGSGTSLLPLSATIVLIAPFAGRVSDRVGRRAPIVVGLLLLTAGLLVLSGLGERSNLAVLLGGLGIAGIGIGLTTSPVTAAALDGVRHDLAGQSAGLLNTGRAIGLSLGVAMMGAIIASSTGAMQAAPGARHAFVAGLSGALRVNAAIALVGASVAAFAIRSTTRRDAHAARARSAIGSPVASLRDAEHSAGGGRRPRRPLRRPAAVPLPQTEDLSHS